METRQKLTRKQQVFVEYLLQHPKASATKAAMVAYDTDSKVVAASIGYENLRKPQIKAYMQSIGEMAEETILQVIRDWGESQNARKRELALRAAIYCHDRVYGRSIAKVEVPTTVTHIAIDLTGQNSEPPADMFDLKPDEYLQVESPN